MSGHFQDQYTYNWPLPLAAITIIMAVSMLVVSMFLQRYFVRGLTSGVLKG
jgi:ABC-type glycerol-3-phosphate transport system permease component